VFQDRKFALRTFRKNRGSAVVLLATAATVAFLQARRATEINPLTALRHE